MEKLSLSSKFSIKNVLRQCASPILMMLFISIYGVVDGIFISQFDGPDAFAGINLIFPIVFIVGGTGFMFGSGGSALTSKLLGEGKRDDANKVFSMMIYFAFTLGVALSMILFPFIDDLVIAMSKLSDTTTQLMIDKATLYGRILICSQPFYIVGTLFQNFFVVDERQGVGFAFTIAAGLTNIVFDALFIGVFKWGVAGAAIATMMGHLINCFGPIIYFLKKKDNLITLVLTRFDFKIIGKCSFNGLSDFIFNISANIIGIVYNIQLLKYIGQVGVSAYGVLMYVSFICISIFIGITMGMAPVIGYNFGAKNHEELKRVIKNTFLIILGFSLVLFGLSFGCARPLARLFSDNKEIAELSEFAMRIYCVSLLVAGFNIFITGMFTALNDGLTSGLISLVRSLISQIIFVFTLPLLFGELGIWISVIAAECFSFVVSIVLFITNKKRFCY